MKGIKKLADKKYFMTIVWILLIIAVWEIFAFIVGATKRTPENILPHLSGIIESVICKRTINGGLTVISAFNAIPIVAMAPVIMNWTKDVSSDASVRSKVAKIIVVTLMCMASISINAYRGLTELKPFSLDLMKSYAADKKTVFLKLRLPNSISYIFTALKVSIPSSVITALVSEYFAEYRAGVGRQIRENILIAQYSTAWVYIAVACIIGIVLFVLFVLLLAIEGIYLKKRST